MKYILLILLLITSFQNAQANTDLIIKNYWDSENYEVSKKYISQAENILSKRKLNIYDRIKLSMIVIDYNIYDEKYKKSYEILLKIKPLFKNYKKLNLETEFAYSKFYSGISSRNLDGCKKSKSYFLEAINEFKKDKSFLYDQLLSLFFVIDCDQENGFLEEAIINLNFIVDITKNQKEDFNEFYEDALRKLSDIYEIKGNFKKSIKYINQIIFNNSKNNKQLLRLYKHISYLYLWSNDKDQSENSLIQALFYLENITDLSQIELNTEYLEISEHFIELNKIKRAESLISKIKIEMNDKNNFEFL